MSNKPIKRHLDMKEKVSLMTGYGPTENKINISHGTKWDQYVRPIGHFKQNGERKGKVLTEL